MYTPSCYIIQCQTNLHAGSGDTNYGIIDKMVQRDAITQLPCIFSSSLKGALREYFEEGPENEKLAALADGVFGKRANKENEAVDNSKGNTIFHEAQMIGMPMRSNMRPFFIATSKVVLENWIIKAGLFGLNVASLETEVAALPDVAYGAPKIIGTAIPGLMVEDFEQVGAINPAVPKLSAILGNDILLMHHDDFKEVCSDYNLPVIARNNLENGESKNLWYEQIVPHQSRFVFYSVSLGTDNFSSHIDGKTIQIGANSSLGYGYCKISKLTTL